MSFKKRIDKNHKCPKCKSVIIFIHRNGFDYDIEYCSDYKCDYEIQYDTSTYINEIENK